MSKGFVLAYILVLILFVHFVLRDLNFDKLWNLFQVDDDFLAQYQMNYGFVDPNKDDKDNSENKDLTENPKETLSKENDKGEKRKAQQEPSKFILYN